MAATDRSFSEVLQDIAGNGREIVRSEVRFAKSEIWDELARAKFSALLTLAGALTAIFTILFVLIAAVDLLSQRVPNWAADLIVGALLALAASFMMAAGSSRFKALYTSPTINTNTNEEHSQWSKQQSN